MSGNKSPFRAILVDLFDTMIYCPWSVLRREMALTSGVSIRDFLAGYSRTQAARNIGVYGSERRDIEEVSRAGGLGLTEEQISSLVQFEQRYLRRHGNYYSDVEQFLDAIQRIGLTSGVISNCSLGAATLIGRLNVRELFDHVFLSFEVGKRKPDREIYQHALSVLKIEPEQVLFIDDQPKFCAGAASVGMSALLINRSVADHKGVAHNLPHIDHLDISVLSRKDLFMSSDNGMPLDF
jgi:putative hydrolase of the HAD superfamily